MNINEFIKNNNLPELKRIGKLKSINYYAEKNPIKNKDTGIPLMIKEVENNFIICNSDEVLKMMTIFWE